jgi:hypothetical protein
MKSELEKARAQQVLDMGEVLPVMYNARPWSELAQWLSDELAKAELRGAESLAGWVPKDGERVAYKPNQDELGTVTRVLRVAYVDWDEGHSGSHEISVLVPSPPEGGPVRKEATVEPRHLDGARDVYKGLPGTWAEDVRLIAQALANAEQAAAAKAWDDGYDEALMRPRGAVNPYRPEPAKGDGK